MEWTDYQLHMPLTSITVSWDRPTRGGWYSFKWAKLLRLRDQEGIYILWYPETPCDPFQVAYVGQGIIRQRVMHHRGNDSRILHKLDAKRLRLTWAIIPDPKVRDGVERYLAEILRPVAGEVWPKALPVRVNLPDW